MRGTVGMIAFAACATICAAVCRPGLNGQADLVRCEGLNASNIEPRGERTRGIEIVNSTIITIEAFSFSWAGDALLELNITGCGVETVLRDAFAGLGELRLLNMADNKIRKIDASWIRGTPRLNALLLWRNRIDEIDPSVYDLLPELRELDLAYNELDECLSRDDLSKLRKLRKILIAGNRWPYRCRPSMTWYLGSNHVLYIADWGANDRLIEDCLAHEPNAVNDDGVLKGCVDRKLGFVDTLPQRVDSLDERVNEIARKLERLSTLVEESKKTKM